MLASVSSLACLAARRDLIAGMSVRISVSASFTTSLSIVTVGVCCSSSAIVLSLDCVSFYCLPETLSLLTFCCRLSLLPTRNARGQLCSARARLDHRFPTGGPRLSGGGPTPMVSSLLTWSKSYAFKPYTNSQMKRNNKHKTHNNITRQKSCGQVA